MQILYDDEFSLAVISLASFLHHRLHTLSITQLYYRSAHIMWHRNERNRTIATVSLPAEIFWQKSSFVSSLPF